jgi:hypothetical protein
MVMQGGGKTAFSEKALTLEAGRSKNGRISYKDRRAGHCEQ